MKFKSITLVVFLVLGSRCPSQTLKALKVKDYPKITFNDNFKSQDQYYIFSDKLFILSDFFVQVVDSNNSIESFNLAKLDKTIAKSISPAYSTEYYFNGYNLLLRSRHYVFSFTYSNKKFNFVRSYMLEKKYGNHLYFNGREIIVYEIYNHHPKSESYRAGYTSINPENGTAVYHPVNFKYFPITHFQPNNFMAFARSFYVIADPFAYEVKFFDYTDKEIGRFSAPDSMFKVSEKISHFSDTALTEKMAHGPSDYFAQLNTDLGNVDRIWTINVIDSATLHIRLTRNSLNAGAGQGQQFYDHIWKKDDGSWHLTQVKYISAQDLKHDINQEELWPYFFPGSKLLYSDNKLIYFFWASTGKTLPQNGEDFYGIKSFDRSNMHMKTIFFKVADK